MFLSAAIIGYAVWRRETIGAQYFYGLLFVAALVILQRVSNLYIAFLRGYKHFSLAARQMVWSSIVNGILVAVLSWRYHFYGFMWAMAASFVFNIFYIICRQRFEFRWTLDTKKIWGLIEYGFPLMLIGFLSTLFLTIDKLMIARMIGVRELGLYSVAILSYTYIGNIPTAIGIVLVPNFHQKYGESQNAADLRGYLSKSSQVFSDLMPLMIAVGWLVVPFFVHAVLPDYQGSIEAMRALILSGYFLALLHPYSYFLAVIRKQVWLLPILFVACGIAFFCNLAAIRHGWGIVGVGVATTVVLFIKFTATYILACEQLFSRKEYWKNYAIYLFKFFFMAGTLFALNRWWPGAERSFWQMAGQCLIFGIFYAPFLWKLNEDLGIFATLKKKFIDKLMPENNLADRGT
ncbi:MAG: polysaccharide biosynthesis C-terminal domain-containing protein [Candidatus Omnitrophica bacterium]|nr:polysaccharide biosynthesis C-terminal domain-containing protein [Candidatus Omnitrophota bacterium]